MKNIVKKLNLIRENMQEPYPENLVYIIFYILIIQCVCNKIHIEY